MAFDRLRVQQPYCMGQYIRCDHNPVSVYVDPEDTKYDPLLYGLGGNRGMMDRDERLEHAKRLVDKHRFLWGEFGEDTPILKNAPDGRQHPQHQEAIALLKKNAKVLKDALYLLKWFSDPGVYLAGGSIVSAVYGEEVKDFDFFFKDKKTRLKFQQFVIAEGYSPVAVTNNAITFTKEDKTPIQLIFNHYYDYPEFCILLFDWSLPQFAIFNQGDANPGFGVSTTDGEDAYVLSGLSYACHYDWGMNIVTRSMHFNTESVGSRHLSFFRALRYKQRYGTTIHPWGFDHQSVSPSSLLSMLEEVYGIPKPWENLWTAPDFEKNYDTLGGLDDISGSAYDNTYFLHHKCHGLVDSHRISWSKASARRIGSEMLTSLKADGLYLPIDNSIIEESRPADAYRYHPRRKHLFMGQANPIHDYKQVINFCIDTTPDKAFSLLLRMVMSLEIACDKAFEEITKEESCQDSILTQQ